MKQFAIAGLLAAFVLPAAAEPNEVAQAEQSAPVSPRVVYVDLRDLPQPEAWQPGDPVREIPRRRYLENQVDVEPVPSADPLAPAQRDYNPFAQRGGSSFTTPNRNFAGQGFSGVNPPDTVGDVGPEHYIQMINAGGGAVVRVYDKAEPTPNVITTFNLDSLGSGVCGNGLGDPIVLWDRQAERWMLSEFSSSGNNLCVYISQTPDPVSGGWFAYGFTAPQFPDYPKYGVWPTDVNGGGGSYVVTSNESAGGGVYVLDRGQMLAGNSATFTRFVLPALSGFGFQASTPADLDGPNPPPANAPAIIMRHRDTEVHSGPGSAPGDLLEMWRLDVDWNNTSNTSLTQIASIDVADFDSSLCGLTSFNCFPQPGTGTTLDPLREVIMNRLQYMNHDDYETLVGNYVVDVDGTNLGGVRWFELRRVGGAAGAWTLHQEGTYTIDNDNRFMAGISMDQSGNIALAYNVSSSSTFPSLRYTGRSFDDALGVMTAPETVIHPGTASNSSNRYGDYSSMNLDPADDCTFWFTGEDNTSSSWRTQIASFKFEQCGCLLAPSPLTPTATPIADNQIEITWDDADLPTVIEYAVRRSRTPGGPYETIATIEDANPGSAGGPSYDFIDTDVDGTITYYYTVVAADDGACRSGADNETSATATGPCGLAPLFTGIASAVTPSFATCTVNLAWPEANAECAGGIVYDVYRSTAPGTPPGPGTLLIEGLSGTTVSDVANLADGVPYYYIVRARDLSNGISDGNTVEIFAVPDGPGSDTCQTGSGCEDNPFVDIDPEGPLEVCSNAIPELTTTLTSGSAPFSFQWEENGIPIPGATDPSYIPTSVGTNSYNCEVKSPECPDAAIDGLPTVLTVKDRADFGGITGANDLRTQTCGVEVSWNPASGPCAGPFSYFVYRDTTPGFVADPSTLVASGLSGTNFVDNDVDQGTDYYYQVQVVEQSTGNADGNSIELQAAPTGPGSGLTTIFFEDFQTSAGFSDWSVTTGPNPHNCGAWSRTGSSGQRPSGGSGNYARTISSSASGNPCNGVLLPRTSTILTSPVIDTDLPGNIVSIVFEADIWYNHANGDDTTIEAFNGSSWVTIWTDPNSDVNGPLSIDVTSIAAGNSDFRLRFSYQNANADQWFTVDNVAVVTNIDNPCAASVGPPPVLPTLTGDKLGSGELQVNWDASSCTAPAYNLIYGDLSGVATSTIDSAECSIGSGSFDWAAPGNNLFFLVVGAAGSEEGSWGPTSDFGERSGVMPSGTCGTTSKTLSGTCP